MSYSAKIPGTKYLVELELEYEDWFLRIAVDGAIEEQIQLDKLTEPGLERALDELIDSISLEVSPFQKEKIKEDIFANSAQILARNQFEQPASESFSRAELAPEPVKSSETEYKSAHNLQKSLIAEYRSKIRAEDKVQVRQITINELKSHDDDTTQIQELVRSHREVQETLKEIDHRVASLEKLTMKLVEITESIIENS